MTPLIKVRYIYELKLCHSLLCMQNCMINVTAGILPEGIKGYITAQDRKSEDEPTGFLFRGGSVSGSGQAFLGRAYGPYSRVIFQETTLSEVVTPEGWFAWNYQGQE
jgi:hypothetical protein